MKVSTLRTNEERLEDKLNEIGWENVLQVMPIPRPVKYDVHQWYLIIYKRGNRQ